MIANFFILALVSIIAGIAFGLIASLILKHVPEINKAPVKECTIIMVFAYLSYLFSERFEFSGIITLFCCGFTMSHYAYHNISEEGQQGSMIAIATVASIAESFLYVYLGLSALTISSTNVIPRFLISVLFSTIIARFISVFLPLLLLRSLKSSTKNPLQWNEAVLITVGGVIRGAIAFGLCLGMDTENFLVIKTTVQIVVLVTTVFFGSTMGMLAKALNIKPDDENI